MQITDKKLAANRANAAKSTGPKEPSIRRKPVNFENLANAILIEGESRPQFIALLNAVYTEFRPATPSERALVDKLGVYQWLHLRALTLESVAVTHQMRVRAETQPDEPALIRAVHASQTVDENSRRTEFSRAASRFDRQYHRTLETLHRIRQMKEQKIVNLATTQPHENKESAPEIESHETH